MGFDASIQRLYFGMWGIGKRSQAAFWKYAQFGVLATETGFMFFIWCSPSAPGLNGNIIIIDAFSLCRHGRHHGGGSAIIYLPVGLVSGRNMTAVAVRYSILFVIWTDLHRSPLP